MKYTLTLLLLLGLSLNADYVKKTTAVCDDADTLLELAELSKQENMAAGSLELEMWLTGHNCKIIDRKTSVEILDYTGKATGIIKVKLKEENDVVYGLGKAFQIEQPGQKNIIKF